MVVGRILQRCAEEMRERLGGLTPRQYLRTHGPLVVTKEYEKPSEIVVGRHQLPWRRLRQLRLGVRRRGGRGRSRHVAGDADRAHDRP